MAEQYQAGAASTILAFVAGISAGAVAGMLLSPRSGSETRQHIKEKVQNVRTKAKDTVDEQKDMIKDKVEDTKKLVKTTADEGREQLQAAKTSRSSNAAM